MKRARSDTELPLVVSKKARVAQSTPSLPPEIYDVIMTHVDTWDDRLALTMICRASRHSSSRSGLLNVLLSSFLEDSLLARRRIELPSCVFRAARAKSLFSANEWTAWSANPGPSEPRHSLEPGNYRDHRPVAERNREEKKMLLARASCVAGGSVRAQVVKTIGMFSTKGRQTTPSTNCSDYDIFFDKRQLEDAKARTILIHWFKPSTRTQHFLHEISPPKYDFTEHKWTKPVQLIMTDFLDQGIAPCRFSALCDKFDLSACQFALHGRWWNAPADDLWCTPLALSSVHTGIAVMFRYMNSLFKFPVIKKLLSATGVKNAAPNESPDVLAEKLATGPSFIRSALKRIGKYMACGYRIPIAFVHSGPDSIRFEVPDWSSYTFFNDIPHIDDILRSLDVIVRSKLARHEIGNYVHDTVFSSRTLAEWPRI